MTSKTLRYRRTEAGTWELLVPGRGWVDERSIPHQLRPWREFEQTVPFAPDGSPDATVLSGEQLFWANSHYLVYVRPVRSEDPDVPDGVHLSIRTVENDTRHDWREFQRIKNELCGPEWEAVELYPADSRAIDTSNHYHLFAFPFRLPFGFETRYVQGEKQLRETAPDSA
jgi:hypothetical protein